MDLIKESIALATKAVKFDSDNCVDAAAYFYNEAANVLEVLVRDNPEYGEKFQKKIDEYRERAALIKMPKPQVEEPKDPDREKYEKCKFLFLEALSADEEGEEEQALKLYTKAIETALELKKEMTNEALISNIVGMMRNGLERAEHLKGIETPALGSRPLEQAIPVASTYREPQRPSKGAGYTDEEKRVLSITSRINNNIYVPFMISDLENERFSFSIPFTDKAGPLKLSPKQRKYFSHWARPEELCSNPKLVEGAYGDYKCIKQTIVSDCSFVASLAVSALYEQRFGKRLITCNIYPQRYNPFGKYMVKLHINGVPRKVIIDDTLPVGKHNELLCSYSTKKHEFWISLLEKAYLKVMGGYDFPGSVSNVDLHALTGWIPEMRSMRHDNFDADATFSMLTQRFALGHVLATVATGQLGEATEERTGLASCHAYALLDVREVNGLKLLLVKNPWSHMSWKGNYSILDATNWTPELCKALNYDPASASTIDNGIFWIDYPSLLRFFDVFYFNWNPEIFKYRDTLTHKCWQTGMGPKKDTYNIGENPQYRLRLLEKTGVVWILLTRHITEIEDFKNNSEYITVLVYGNDGKKVYYPDKNLLMNGIRINSPHYLVKINFDEIKEKNLTLVISQYEKMHTIYYTLRAYSTSKISLSELDNPYKYKMKVMDGEWKGVTAGGCANHLTYSNNPSYKLVLKSRACLMIQLKAPKEYSVGIDILGLNVPGFTKQSTPLFRPGFVYLEFEDIPEGTYQIIPSTFLPGQESKFFLEFQASCPLEVQKYS